MFQISAYNDDYKHSYEYLEGRGKWRLKFYKSSQRLRPSLIEASMSRKWQSVLVSTPGKDTGSWNTLHPGGAGGIAIITVLFMEWLEKRNLLPHPPQQLGDMPSVHPKSYVTASWKKFKLLEDLTYLGEGCP